MHYKLYRDTNRKWRWRLVATNGRIVADSAEGYSRKKDALHGISLVKGSTDAEIREDKDR